MQAGEDEILPLARKALSEIEHNGDDPEAYDMLTNVIRQYDISVGADNPSVRARLALAELADLLSTDYPLDLGELKGRVVVLNFWATWCGPCQTEMVFLDKLAKEGVAVLAVSDEDPGVVRTFLSRHGYTVKVLLDPSRKVFDRFRATALPATRILDGSGRLRAETQETTEAELRDLIKVFQQPSGDSAER